jgi:hypothetical protein
VSENACDRCRERGGACVTEVVELSAVRLTRRRLKRETPARRGRRGQRIGVGSGVAQDDPARASHSSCAEVVLSARGGVQAVFTNPPVQQESSTSSPLIVQRASTGLQVRSRRRRTGRPPVCIELPRRGRKRVHARRSQARAGVDLPGVIMGCTASTPSRARAACRVRFT